MTKLRLILEKQRNDTLLPTILKLNLAGAILNLHVIGNTEYAAVVVNATTTPILTSGVRVEIGSTIIWSFHFGHSNQ